MARHVTASHSARQHIPPPPAPVSPATLTSIRTHHMHTRMHACMRTCRMLYRLMRTCSHAATRKTLCIRRRCDRDVTSNCGQNKLRAECVIDTLFDVPFGSWCTRSAQLLVRRIRLKLGPCVLINCVCSLWFKNAMMMRQSWSTKKKNGAVHTFELNSKEDPHCLLLKCSRPLESLLLLLDTVCACVCVL